MNVEQEFFIGVQAVDSNKMITNLAILEMFSNMSMLHSFKAGQTKDSGLSPVSWVVINWKMKVLKRVKLFSTVRAETRIQKIKGYRAIRSYAAYDEAGDVVAVAEGEWVAIDTAKGTFIRLKPEFMECFQIEETDDKEPYTSLASEFSSIDLTRDCPQPVLAKEADVYKSFFDYNGHVHNSEYLNFAELVLPKEYNMQDMKMMELQFKLEIKSDEPKVLIEYARIEEQHIVTVHSLQNHDFHAGIILTGGK